MPSRLRADKQAGQRLYVRGRFATLLSQRRGQRPIARWRRGSLARAPGITKQERAMAKGQQRSGREAKKPKADKKPAPAAGTQQYKLPAQTAPVKGGK